jgi:hypothetical protein
MIITSSPKNKHLLGDNNKALNRRVLSTVDLNSSTLVVDLHYYGSLVDNKLKYSSSFGPKWASLAAGRNDIAALQAVDNIFEPILKLKRIITIQKVILLCEPFNKLTNTEKELFKLFTSVISFSVVCSKHDMVRSLYSLAVTDKSRYIILSDNIEFWAICSKKSDIHHAVVVKNNNIRLYTDKFGLEYLSSLIQTNKLVNKLRLSKLKYVNLQYLFMLLLYTKFKQVKSNEEFDLSDQAYLGSKGKGLKLLSEAHKEISYYFLTKIDMVDIFLTSSATHFTLNLSRLLKITPFDLNLMSGFANYYAANAIRQIEIHKIPAGSPYYKLVERSKLYCFKGVPTIPKTGKKVLPNPPVEFDITTMETSMAIDAILKGLAW